MERVDHVHVVEVGSRRFIGEVDRVVQRQVPDREGLKFCIARVDAAQMLVVKLRQAGRHLAAAGSRRGDHDQAAGRFDVFVFAVAVCGYDQLDVGGVALDFVMHEDREPQRCQLGLEPVGRLLAAVLCDDHGADVQPDRTEQIDQPQHLEFIADAEIGTQLFAFDGAGGHGDDDFRLVLELQQHAQLAVRLKARQHTRGVVVVKQLAAEFHIQLAAELAHALADMLGLHADVLVVVKP